MFQQLILVSRLEDMALLPYMGSFYSHNIWAITTVDSQYWSVCVKFCEEETLKSFMFEIALYIALLWSTACQKCNSKLDPVMLPQKLLTASTYMTSVTPVMATSLIIYRILSLSKYSPMAPKKRRIRYIIELLLQSAGIYALTTFAFATCLALTVRAYNAFDFNARGILAVSEIMNVVFFFFAVHARLPIIHSALQFNICTSFPGCSAHCHGG